MLTIFALRFIKDIEETAAFITLAEAGAFLVSNPKLDFSQFSPEWASALTLARIAPKSFADHASYERFWREVMITRLVDRFTIYIGELLAAILIARPQLLSEQKAPISDVLSHASMADFVQTFARRRADELSYGGFLEMRRFLTTKIGLEPDVDPAVLKEVTVALATRNAIVHNRGHVSERYLKETGRTDLHLGSAVPLHMTGIASLHHLAVVIDQAAVTKFGDAIRTTVAGDS